MATGEPLLSRRRLVVFLSALLAARQFAPNPDVTLGSTIAIINAHPA